MNWPRLNGGRNAAGGRIQTDAALRTGSLRRRVVAVVLVLMVVVLTGLCLVINLLLSQALHSDLRQRLTDKVSAAVALDASGVSGQTLADQLSGGGVFASFESGGRRYIGREQDPGPRRPGNGPGAKPLPGRAQPVAIPPTQVSEANGQLVESVTLTDGVLTLSTGEVDINRTLAALTRIELLAGAATILITGGLGLVLVRAALRPLNRMTLLANRIRGGARGRRFRPTRPKTDLGRTASAFDGMLDALEAAESSAQAAERQMRQFLADASHDLRTPLAGVIAGAESLLLSDRSRRDRETRVVELIREARRAARLVDDLLRLARLDGLAELPTTGAVVQLSDPAALHGQEEPFNPARLGGPAVARDPARLSAPADSTGRADPAVARDPARSSDPARLGGPAVARDPARLSAPADSTGRADSQAWAGSTDPGRLHRLADPYVHGHAAEPRAVRAVLDLRHPAGREVESLRLRFPGIEVLFYASAEVQVVADVDELQRALGNLLDNAAKVTPPGGRIIATITAEQDWAVMIVADSGPGVPEADRERIFDRFVRLEDSRSSPGSGLGLPIARSIARRHGGEVRCQPTFGGDGARFELILPMMHIAPQPVASEPSGQVLAVS